MLGPVLTGNLEKSENVVDANGFSFIHELWPLPSNEIYSLINSKTHLSTVKALAQLESWGRDTSVRIARCHASFTAT